MKSKTTKSLQNFSSNLGFNEPQEWSKEHFNNVQTYIKNQYDQFTPEQKLEIELYAIKAKKRHSQKRNIPINSITRL